MNDCIHALHRRLDCHLINDIADNNLYLWRKYARCKYINREGTNPVTGLIQSMYDTRSHSTSGTRNEDERRLVYRCHALPSDPMMPLAPVTKGLLIKSILSSTADCSS